MFHSGLLGSALHISKLQTGSGSPISAVTPGVIGQAYWDLTGKKLYIANGLLNTDWDLVSSGGGGGATLVSETLTVSAPNTLSNLSISPIDPTTSFLEINGLDAIYTTHFTIAVTTVTLVPANIGYDITSDFTVVVKYFI
jgi:hypothetical protein